MSGNNESRMIRKRLWLRNQKTPWGSVKIWTLRNYSKGIPIQVYFWDTPERFLEG